MRVIVTGGAGYIGSHVVHNLVDTGYQVEVIDNLISGDKSLVPLNVKVHQVNVGNKNLIGEILKSYLPDIVIHFAASVEVEESVKNPLKYYENNTFNSLAFIQSCIEAKIKHFIFSSTAAVYGNQKKQPIPETAKPNPDSPYGKSKLFLEEIIRDVAVSKNLTFLNLRYFNVAGADPLKRTGQIKEPASHLIKIACETAIGKRKKIQVYGDNYKTFDGSCIRDYIHVSDLADLHIKAGEYLLNGGHSNTLNCGYGNGFSVFQVINEMKNISEIDFPVEIIGRRLGDTQEVVADNSLCNKILKWEPKRNKLNTIIKDAFEWEKILNQRNQA